MEYYGIISFRLIFDLSPVTKYNFIFGVKGLTNLMEIMSIKEKGKCQIYIGIENIVGS